MKKERTIEELNLIKSSWYIDDNNSLRWLRKPNNGNIGDLVGLTTLKSKHRLCMLRVNGKQKNFVESNVIWYLRNNEWPLCEIDHIDRDPTNNSTDNLRLATRSENMMNCKPRPNKSGHKGIHPRYGKWSVQIWKNKKCHTLGVFDTIEEAIMIHKQGVERLHGEFARTTE